MTPPANRRWSLAFLAMRWRHLFWILPLLGLLTGSAIEWRRYRHENRTHGVVHLSTSPFIIGADPSSFTQRLGDFRNILLSDVVLNAAGHDAAVHHRTLSKKDSIAELRALVECDHIPHTPLLVITVKGKKTTWTIDFCRALIQRSTDRVVEIRGADYWKKSEEATIEFEKLQRNLDLKRVEMTCPMSDAPANLTCLPDSPMGVPLECAELRRLESEFGEASNADHSKYMRIVEFGNPVNIHEFPAAMRPFSVASLLKPATRVGIWIGITMAAAVVVPYLLKSILPSKAIHEITSPDKIS